MPYLQTVSVSCTSLSKTILQKANELAKNLNLPFRHPDQCQDGYMLVYTDDHLEMRYLPDDSDTEKFRPLVVDFIKGASRYRHATNLTTKQPLARAVGIKPGFRPDIFDATAGLGEDGFVLACLGCKVTLSERSPVIGALLADGLLRAADDQYAGPVIEQRIQLIIGDAKETLAATPTPPHTVYLDPMYPHRKKSALNKKEMRLIRGLIGDDPDGPELLDTALSHATNRVVVKRPKGADLLGERMPHHEVIMKNSRFDIYLINHL